MVLFLNFQSTLVLHCLMGLFTWGIIVLSYNCWFDYGGREYFLSKYGHHGNNQSEVLEPIKEKEQPILTQIQLEKYVEISLELEKAKTELEELKSLVPNTTNCMKFPATRKKIQMAIIVHGQKFYSRSNSIEVFGFKWYMEVRISKESGWLALLLFAKSPAGFNGSFRIEIDFRLSILNAFHDKDVSEEKVGQVYDDRRGCGFETKIEDLFDPAKGFLNPDGTIVVEADFTIKSSTLNHLI